MNEDILHHNADGTVYHKLVMAHVERMTYDRETRSGVLYIAPHEAPDMGGTIELFEGVDPDVRLVDVYSGTEPDTRFLRRHGDDWDPICMRGRSVMEFEHTRRRIIGG